jgi:hypothetical protein
MSKPGIFLMALLCAFVLGAAIYLRLEDGGGLARGGVLIASVVMAVGIVVLVGRAGRGDGG